MRLLSLSLRNIGAFSNFSTDFSGNLIGIIGSNGSGKSTLVEALYSGLTGDFRKYPTLLDFLKDLPEGKKANSGTIKLSFLFNEIEVTITRKLKINQTKASQSVSATFKIPGQDKRVITGTKALSNELQQLFGADFNLLGFYSFISQDKISSIVTVSENDRTALIHKLLKLDKYEKIWTLLGEESRAIPELELVDNKVVVQEDLKIKQKELKLLKDEITKLENKLKKLDIPRSMELLEKWESLESLRSECRVLDAIKTEVSKKIEELKSQEKKLKDKIKQFDEASYDLNKRKINADIQIWQLHEKYVGKLNQLNNEAKELTAKIQNLKKPDEPLIEWTEGEQQELDQLNYELKSIIEFITKCSDVTDAKCPTCGQIISNLDQELKKRKEKRKVLLQRISELNDKKEKYLENYQKYEKSLIKYEAEFKNYVERCKAIALEAEKLNEELRKLPLPKSSIDELREELLNLDTQQREYQNLKDRCIEISTLLDQEEDRLNETIKKYDLLLAKTKEIEPSLINFTVDKIDELKKKIRDGSELKIQLARLKTNYENLKITIKDYECRLVRITELEKKRENYKEVKQDLLDAREIFHRANLPLKLAAAYIAKIDAQMRDFLSLMGAPFTVKLELDKGYRFNCIFPDGTSRDARHLSGGEKVKFSIAFYLAIHSLLAGRIGVLSLDEPTAQLDDESIKNLGETLHRVRGYAKNSGLQIFLITHSPQLHGCFDQTIQLTKQLI